MASVLRFLGVPLRIPLYGECFLVALFFATLRSVPTLRLFPDELPCDPDTMATQLLPELWGAAVGDEYHRHNLLVRVCARTRKAHTLTATCYMHADPS